jgi:hypothetical protein
MAAYNLSSFAGAGWQFFDDNGDVLSGGKLYTYAAGTTTPAATYTTNTGSASHTNPIVLDAAGRVPAEIWLPVGQQFKFTVKTSTETLIGTYDNILPINDPGSINSLLSNVTGTNAIAATATPTITSYSTGATYSFVAANANTGAVTISIDGLTVKSITKAGSIALVAGDIQAGGMVHVQYDGTRFQLLNNVVYGGSVTNAAISGTTTITGATITGGTVSGLTTDLAIADGGTGASTALAAFDALKQAATATYVGAVELATDAEVITGTDITRAMTPASFRAGNIVSGTAVVSTSGTSIDFTSIPSWAKRITVMFSGVSLSGSSSILVQIGSATLETTGYISQASLMSTAVTSTSSTAGFIVDPGSSATLMYGVLDIYLLDVTTNTWVERHTLGRSTPGSSVGGGTKALSGTLQRLRITTVNGTDTFDAGTVNIMWE